jgi:hypothetical protein
MFLHKTIQLSLACIVILFVGVSISSAEIYTTGVDVWDMGSEPGYEHVWSVNAWTEPNCGGNGGELELSMEDNSDHTLKYLHPVNGTVGIDHKWFYYAYNPGEYFDTQTMVKSMSEYPPMDYPYYLNWQNPPTLPDYIGMYANALYYPQFYLAFWLDADNDGVSDSSDRFGWVKLEYDNNSDTLSLLGSGIENNGSGIIVGEVPEPSTATLLLAPLAFLAFRIFIRKKKV